MITFYKMNNGCDAALVVNDQIVASVDTQFEEDGSIANCEFIAERLAVALELPLQIVDISTPETEGWSWDEIIDDHQKTGV